MYLMQREKIGNSGNLFRKYIETDQNKKNETKRFWGCTKFSKLRSTFFETL